MSELVHHCRTCGHRGGWHQAEARGYTSCPCCHSGDADLGNPVLVPTWTHPGARPEGLYRPGSTRNHGSMHRTTTCACDDCRTLYATLTDPGTASAG